MKLRKILLSFLDSQHAFYVLILFLCIVIINQCLLIEVRCGLNHANDISHDPFFLDSSQPIVDIKANNSDKTLKVLSKDKISISLSLDPGSYTKQKTDWWIVANTPVGIFSYVYPKWQKDLYYCLQAPLYKFSAFQILNSPLPKGEYTFYFIVDNNANGVIDVTWCDSITVHVLSSLEVVDNSSLYNRTPLILVHGNGGEAKPNYRWGNFLKQSKKDSEFLDKFKIYLFQWDSDQSNKFNADALGIAIDGQEELNDKKIIILAHSRGGLVSRYYLNDYITKTGLYSNQPAGQRVDNLITLGTPHRGSPVADPYWTIFSLDYNYQPFIARQLSFFYLNYVYDSSAKNMLWDDTEDELTRSKVCWAPAILDNQTEFCTVLPSTQSQLSRLNSKDSYLDKIIAFGGNEFNGQDILLNYKWDEHKALSLSSTFLAETPIIPPNYPYKTINDQYLPFRANDGLVPLISALPLETGSGNLFTVRDGQLIYDPQKIDSLCQLQKCIVIKDRQVDHLDFLDDQDIINSIIKTIKKIDHP